MKFIFFIVFLTPWQKKYSCQKLLKPYFIPENKEAKTGQKKMNYLLQKEERLIA